MRGHLLYESSKEKFKKQSSFQGSQPTRIRVKKKNSDAEKSEMISSYLHLRGTRSVSRLDSGALRVSYDCKKTFRE